MALWWIAALALALACAGEPAEPVATAVPAPPRRYEGSRPAGEAPLCAKGCQHVAECGIATEEACRAGCVTTSSADALVALKTPCDALRVPLAGRAFGGSVCETHRSDCPTTAECCAPGEDGRGVCVPYDTCSTPP